LISLNEEICVRGIVPHLYFAVRGGVSLLSAIQSRPGSQ
jgi:hypothetical protein